MESLFIVWIHTNSTNATTCDFASGERTSRRGQTVHSTETRCDREPETKCDTSRGWPRARALAAWNWTARTQFLKLVHVAKIGTKPCELESHRLRTNSSHMQPCFPGSLAGCAGRAPAHAPHARSLNVQLSPTLSSALPPVRNASHASWLTCRSPCVQLIHDAHVHHRMRSSCGTVVTVLRRHTKRSSSCLPRCLCLNC